MANWTATRASSQVMGTGGSELVSLWTSRATIGGHAEIARTLFRRERGSRCCLRRPLCRRWSISLLPRRWPPFGRQASHPASPKCRGTDTSRKWPASQPDRTDSYCADRSCPIWRRAKFERKVGCGPVPNPAGRAKDVRSRPWLRENAKDRNSARITFFSSFSKFNAPARSTAKTVLSE